MPFVVHRENSVGLLFLILARRADEVIEHRAGRRPLKCQLDGPQRHLVGKRIGHDPLLDHGRAVDGRQCQLDGRTGLRRRVFAPPFFDAGVAVILQQVEFHAVARAQCQRGAFRPVGRSGLEGAIERAPDRVRRGIIVI